MQRFLKRQIDIVVAAGGLLLLSPLLAAVAIAVRLTMGGPVLFCQQRPGLGGAPFTLYKFRTMLHARDKRGQQLPDDQRLTAVGRFLRSTSLDELPELFNVLRGEMSLVGPRPLLMEYLDRYTEEQARRHETIPGITGWAQINGRNHLTWDERFKLDVWYVDHWSLWLDFTILFRTLRKVITAEGVAAPGHSTMPLFRGTSAHDDQMSLD